MSNKTRQVINSVYAPAPIGPYSQAILVDGTLYVSGQIALVATTGALCDEGVEAETEQVLKNIGYVLAAADMNFSHVVKCSIFIKNMGDFQKINAIYAKYFKENPPARETVEVSALPKNVSVEISCIAVK
ncbi:MAG: RidA family protein [Cytophagales bacterium]|nr:MAG: RidA family protein [Cytophagales bacterium]TAF59536.1 MAG: RidA family protein [Cytophagales bacterium]